MGLTLLRAQHLDGEAVQVVLGAGATSGDQPAVAILARGAGAGRSCLLWANRCSGSRGAAARRSAPAAARDLRRSARLLQNAGEVSADLLGSGDGRDRRRARRIERCGGAEEHLGRRHPSRHPGCPPRGGDLPCRPATAAGDRRPPARARRCADDADRRALWAGVRGLGSGAAHRTYYGRALSRAARIEPITPPGTVYVTEAFAAILLLESRGEFTCTYVGQVPLAKGYGTFRMYDLVCRLSEAAAWCLAKTLRDKGGAKAGRSRTPTNVKGEAMQHAALANVPTQLFLGGEWRDASDGETFEVDNPGDRRGDRQGGERQRRGRQEGARCGRSRLSRLGCGEAARARRGSAQGLRADHGGEGGARAAHHAGERQGAAGFARRDRLCGGVLPLELGGGGAGDRRPLSRPVERRAHPRRAQAGGNRGARHAVEFSRGDGDAKDRAGARRRLPGDPEAGLGDAAHHAGADADSGGGGRAEGGRQRAALGADRRSWWIRCCTTIACASSPSPARPRWGESC